MIDDDTKGEIKDYYLSLLHTIQISRNEKSYFLSSTDDRSVAECFSSDDTGEKGIIIYGWVPKKSLNKMTISYNDIMSKNEKIESFGLPAYNIPVYPEQKEICLKCGLLPHFIIGFQFNNKFYINPNSLKEWSDDIICNGLDIDQSMFPVKFDQTKFKSQFIFCDGEYYMINDKEVVKI